MIDGNKIIKYTKVYVYDEWEDDWIEAIFLSYDETRRKKRFLVQYYYYEDEENGLHAVNERFNYCSLKKKEEC